MLSRESNTICLGNNNRYQAALLGLTQRPEDWDAQEWGYPAGTTWGDLTETEQKEIASKLTMQRRQSSIMKTVEDTVKSILAPSEPTAPGTARLPGTEPKIFGIDQRTFLIGAAVVGGLFILPAIFRR